MTNLIIIADDLGLHPKVNEGIIKALREDWISGASLMANGEAFDDTINKLMAVEPPLMLNIGIHFGLVEEKSLTGMILPKDHVVFFVKYMLGLIKLSDIEKELRAQLDKCIKAGVKPSFINSHQHLHLLPGIMNIVVKLAKEYKAPYIRIVNESIRGNGGLFRKLQLFVLKKLSEAAKNKIKTAGLGCNDYFVGFLNAGDLTDEDIEGAKDLAKKFPDKIIELGCHLGFENEELKNKYKHWGGYNWEKELELLKNAKRFL